MDPLSSFNRTYILLPPPFIQSHIRSTKKKKKKPPLRVFSLIDDTLHPEILQSLSRKIRSKRWIYSMYVSLYLSIYVHKYVYVDSLRSHLR